MRHECRTKIQKCKLIPDINCIIRKDEDMDIWKLSLVDNDKRIGMGIFIFHCPFCGKELGEKSLSFPHRVAGAQAKSLDKKILEEGVNDQAK